MNKTRARRWFPTLLALACCLGGCRTSPTLDEERRELWVKLRGVVVEDGINADEAEIIARSYYLKFTPTACGGMAHVVEQGNFWVAPTLFGIAGMPTREPIRIDKRTGRVTWSEGPTIDDPKTIW